MAHCKIQEDKTTSSIKSVQTPSACIWQVVRKKGKKRKKEK